MSSYFNYQIIDPEKSSSIPFKDENFEKIVRFNTNKPVENINISNMKNVTTLYSQGMNIEDIHGIENLVVLKELYLSGNKITDITPLSSLTSLEKLFLDNNQII